MGAPDPGKDTGRARALTARSFGRPTVIVAVVVAVVFVILAAIRPPTPVEIALFQVIVLLAGLAGAYAEGAQAGLDAERAARVQHGRSAFQRVVSLYSALRDLAVSIEERRAVLVTQGDAGRPKGIDPALVEASLDLLDRQVREQIRTANDAMLDWRDIVPDEVDKLQRIAGKIEEEHPRTL